MNMKTWALYERTLRLARHRWAGGTLAVVSFVESWIFPIPPDALLVPMVLAAPERVWRYATVCTLASVAGGLLGYAIGSVLFETVGHFLLTVYASGQNFEAFQDLYNRHGAWIVALGGFTPVPFKVVTVASGAVGLNLGVFIIASLVSRGLRFFLVAWLVARFGESMRLWLARHFGWVSLVLFACVVGGVILFS